MRPKDGYSRQFKEQAMDMVRVRIQSVASASRELGIVRYLLGLSRGDPARLQRCVL